MAKKRTKYLLKDGQAVPGTTTILSVISKEPLYYWYAKHGLDGSKKLLEAAGEFGSTVHSLIEAIYNGQKPRLTADHKTILDNFQALIDPLVGKWDWFERQILSEKHGYGGTADLAFIGKDGKHYLADIKTSSGVWPEYSLQLAAYEAALAEEGEKYDEKVIFWLNKETLTWEVIYINTDGLLDVFLAALKVWKWKTGKE